MAAAKYDSLFTTNTKTELKADALTLLNDWILDEVQMACDHGAGSAEARTMKDLVRMDKSSLSGLYVNGEFERFDELNNLIDYMNHVSVDLNHHNHLKVPSRDGKYLVIFKESSTLFPDHNAITGKDWTDIIDKAPPATVSDPALNEISTTFKEMFKRGADRKDLDDMKKLVINVVGLPDDVKKIYIQQQKKERITKSDIKKFQNILTIAARDATNTQLELNFIKWPKEKLNFLIYKDGSIFQCVCKVIKDQQENFLKSLMEIKEWNAQTFYALYQNIEGQCFQHCIWVLPYMCHSKDCNSELNFVCDDEFANNDADLPIELQNAVPVWSTITYNALKHEEVLPAAAKTILMTCGRCGYSFLCRGCVMFHLKFSNSSAATQVQTCI